MHEFIAPSGTKVTISPAPWVDARRLKAAVERELARAGIQIDTKEASAGSLIEAILKVDCSEEVETTMFSCLARCLYGTEKITPQTFDKVEARQDYYQIMSACLMENFRPLVESLLSALPINLKGMLAKTNPEENQK